MLRERSNKLPTGGKVASERTAGKGSGDDESDARTQREARRSSAGREITVEHGRRSIGSHEVSNG